MRNYLLERLRDGHTACGLWVTLESPSITEIAVALAVDWVCIDMEHGHLGFRDVLEHARAARGGETAVLVRVPAIQPDAIKRALDLGVDGVLLPMVRSVADLVSGLQAARYPPAGGRGVGGERAVGWGLRFEEYLRQANENVMVIPLIETREAVEAIDALLAVPGLDAIFFGPADLSASYGHLGAWEGDGVAERILDVKNRAARRGIATGIMARDRADARSRQEQGFRMVGLGTDAVLLRHQLADLLVTVRGPTDIGCED